MLRMVGKMNVLSVSYSAELELWATWYVTLLSSQRSHQGSAVAPPAESTTVFLIMCQCITNKYMLIANTYMLITIN